MGEVTVGSTWRRKADGTAVTVMAYNEGPSYTSVTVLSRVRAYEVSRKRFMRDYEPVEVPGFKSDAEDLDRCSRCGHAHLSHEFARLLRGRHIAVYCHTNDHSCYRDAHGNYPELEEVLGE